MQVSSILQQYMVDDLLLVAIDINITLHIISLSLKEAVLRLLWKRSQLLLAAVWKLILNPGLVEAKESVCT